MRARWFIIFCVLLWLLPRASAAVESFRVFSEPVRASALIGMEVRDTLGVRAGLVRDVVLDLNNNRVHYVVVESGTHYRRLPMHAFTLPRHAGHLILERPEARVEAARDDAMPVPASRLIGRSFSWPQGAPAGRVADVVLDAFWGEVAFAAVRLGEDPALRPVPLDAFQAGQPFALSIARPKLKALPGFTWEELQAGIADRAFLQRTTRHAHRLTPLP